MGKTSNLTERAKLNWKFLILNHLKGNVCTRKRFLNIFNYEFFYETSSNYIRSVSIHFKEHIVKLIVS